MLGSTPLGLAQEQPDPETVEEFKRYLIVSGWTQHLRIPAGENINSFIAGLGYRQEFAHENGRTWSFYGGFYNDSRYVVSRVDGGPEYPVPGRLLQRFSLRGVHQRRRRMLCPMGLV
jgi:hypothetical protein